ncbi:hypothetical protein [Facklamia sp. P9177]
MDIQVYFFYNENIKSMV